MILESSYRKKYGNGDNMTKNKIVIMPGDGIGKVVLPEAIRVLDAVKFDAEYIHGDIGWEFWKNEGNALPERTLKLLEEHKISLFGAITSKPKDQASKALIPELQGKGHVYYSPIFQLRYLHTSMLLFQGKPIKFHHEKRRWI